MNTQPVGFDSFHGAELQVVGVEDVVDTEGEWMVDGGSVAEAGVPPGIAEASSTQHSQGTGAGDVVHIAEDQSRTV